ncbi:ABC transporter permease [Ruoffia sp. FAM 24228]|uniref:ABC transporter permease n=1 Tax=Ruoffia sp. FAM 24228 TaxID=3259517 RepID=UPI003886A595
MIDYLVRYSDRLIDATVTHLQLVTISLLIAIAIAGVIIYTLIHNQRWLKRLTYFFSALYSVPSYALFALLIPVTGLGADTAMIVLTLYCEYILLRTFSTGIQEIDPMIVEAAIGMGMTDKELFFRIYLPLSSKTIFSGIRLAMTSSIGIATIGATINAGGLGTILFSGLRTQDMVQILWGMILTVLLCIACNFILKQIEKFALRNYELEG